MHRDDQTDKMDTKIGRSNGKTPEQHSGQKIDMDEHYSLACDAYDLKQNLVLSEFAAAHPECVPGDDAGAHYCVYSMLWLLLRLQP
jgi:hypothetical protein